MTWQEPDPGAIETGQTCPFCGGPEWIDLFELWIEDRAFQFTSCCAGSWEAWAEDMAHWTRQDWKTFFEQTAGLKVRQVVGHCGQLTLDYGLEIRPVSQKTARAFVETHHRHHKAPAGWRWGHGLYNGGELVGIAWVGRPVARRLDPAQVVEVNRLCVRSDLAPGLVWNGCSQLYGAAAREAKRRGFRLILTYTLETEAGTTLKAAGWDRAALTKGGSWSRPSRTRVDQAPTCRKVRWERRLAA